MAEITQDNLAAVSLAVARGKRGKPAWHRGSQSASKSEPHGGNKFAAGWPAAHKSWCLGCKLLAESLMTSAVQSLGAGRTPAPLVIAGCTTVIVLALVLMRFS